MMALCSRRTMNLTIRCSRPLIWFISSPASCRSSIVSCRCSSVPRQKVSMLLEDMLRNLIYRIRIFESLLKCSSEVIKQELLESQMVHRIINTLLASKTELDVSFYRSNYKFLVFSNFLPFRAEALALISLDILEQNRQRENLQRAYK
jgi:hypothetical protein